MRALWVLAVVALVAPLVAADAPVGPTLPWNTLDCEFIYATALIPAARLAPYVPGPSWRVYSTSTLTANALATVSFEADVCREGSGIDGQVAPMLYASTWVPVQPPPRYDTEVLFTVLAWDILVPDDERRALLEGVAADVHDGEIIISEDLRDGATLPFRVDYALAGAGAFSFEVVPGPETTAPGTGGEFDQYVRGSDGSFTYWRTQWSASRGQTGTGVVHLDPASWQAAAFGATEVPARFNFGVWDYEGGRIVLPS